MEIGDQGFQIGGAPYLVVSLADAIFQPLAVRQTVRARQAQVQAAANDTLLALTQAYFNLQQARGELAGYRDTLQYADDLLRRLDKLAPGLTPTLEVNRARTLGARLRQVTLQSQNNWRAASAELLRVLYLDPTLVQGCIQVEVNQGGEGGLPPDARPSGEWRRLCW